MAKPRRRVSNVPRLSVVLDEGVPVSVGNVFEQAGYRAFRHGELFPAGASDFRVAQAALTVGAVLVAVDNDMKRIAGRYGSSDPKYARLNLIKIACQEPLAASRIQQAMALIELGWLCACEKFARRLYLDIGPHYMRTFR